MGPQALSASCTQTIVSFLIIYKRMVEVQLVLEPSVMLTASYDCTLHMECFNVIVSVLVFVSTFNCIKVGAVLLVHI